MNVVSGPTMSTTPAGHFKTSLSLEDKSALSPSFGYRREVLSHQICFFVDHVLTSILWPPDIKKWLIGKDPDAGKDWRQEEKGTREDEMVGCPPTWWTWVWVSSRSWWWTGKPGVLQSMELQRVGHDWTTELKWTESNFTRTHSHVQS